MRLYSARERLILRKLSENSRATITEIAKEVKCSRATVVKYTDKLVNDLDVRFTLELELDKLLLQGNMIWIRFTKAAPPYSLLKEVLKSEKVSLCAFATKGNLDLAILAVSANPMEYSYWEVITTQRLADYGPRIKLSHLSFMHFGFIPISSAIFDRLNRMAEIEEKDIRLLKLLNENSRLSYTELARLTKMNEDTIRYRMFALKKRGIIKRFTIAIQKPPQGYILAFSEDFTITREFEAHANVARTEFINADQNFPVANTFQFVGSLTGGYSNFIMALFDDRKEAMGKIVNRHKTIYRTESLEIKRVRVKGVVEGLFPFRNLEVRPNYKVVKWGE